MKRKLLFLMTAAVSVWSCVTTTSPHDPRYVRDGQQYGVTRGLFNHRSW